MHAVAAQSATPFAPALLSPSSNPATGLLEVEVLGTPLQLFRRSVQAREHLFRAGQPLNSLYMIHAGCFKTSLLSEDGREKITGFRLRGDMLALDALGTPVYGCDAIALDTSEVWELPRAQIDTISAQAPQFRERLTAVLAGEIRRDWHWMLTLATLNAEQRVAAFLLDLAERQRALGYSARQLFLRMTRAELGNFLALQLETVTRALSRLVAQGIIAVERRDVRLNDPGALQALLGSPRACH